MVHFLPDIKRFLAQISLLFCILNVWATFLNLWTFLNACQADLVCVTVYHTRLFKRMLSGGSEGTKDR